MNHDEFLGFLLLLGRYVHIIAGALLLGGTVFYELVVPVAIDDLKDEQKLWIFARARWAFRWLVWCCTVALLVSGAFSTYRNWYAYNGVESQWTMWGYSTTPGGLRLVGPGYWWLAHAVLSTLGIGIALALVMGRTPPRYPLVWMRINIVILMVVVFLASTTRHLRLRMIESHLPAHIPASVE